MDERRPEGEELTLGRLLAQVCRMSGHLLHGHMKRIGLHRGQGFALVQLWHHDGVPQRDLADAMHISPASVTAMLQRMERDGWITRERDETDQRLVRVFLTEQAKELRDAARDAFQRMEADLAAIYTEEERTTLHRLLLKLHDHFAPDHPAVIHHREGCGWKETG